MENQDKQCFKWCVVRALNPVAHKSERITKLLRKQAEKLNFQVVKFLRAILTNLKNKN